MVILQEEVFKDIGIAPPLSPVPPFVTEWTVPVDLPYFNGHFPGFAVFPGVGIVDATLFFLQRALSNPNLTLSGVPSAKFLNPVSPGQKVRIELSIVGEKVWHAEWKDESSAKVLASLRIEL